VLMALSSEKGQEPKVAALRRGLDAMKNSGDYWSNTQDNLWALVALAGLVHSQESADMPYTLKMNGKVLARGTNKGPAVFARSFPLSQLAPGAFEIVTEGVGEYGVRLVLARSEKLDTALNNGIRVARRYLKPGTVEPIASMRVGDLVQVEVGIELAVDSRYIALVDSLPAGFEAVNTRLVSEAVAAGQNAWDYYLTYQELHDDRVMAFYDWLPQGTYQFKYLARALTPGIFTAPPARAEAMYSPALNGRTASARVEVK